MNTKTRYLTSSLAVAATGACVDSAQASVLTTAHNTTFTHAGGGAFEIDINGDSDPDYRFVYANDNATKPQITTANFGGGGINQVLMPLTDNGHRTLPVLDADAVIDLSLYGGAHLNEAFFYQNYETNYFGDWGGPGGATAPDPILSPITGYVALAIPTDATQTSFNFGYAHVRVDVPAGTLRVFETGYETDADTAITIPPHDPELVAPEDISDSAGAGPITMEIPVSNGGTTNPLHITGGSFSGYDASYFTIEEAVSEETPLVIAPGGSTTFTIGFDPAGETGIFTATLELTSNDPFAPTFHVPLTVEVDEPDVVVPGTLDLGPVAHDAGVQNFSVEIRNDGFGDLDVYDAWFSSGTYASRLGITHDFASFLTVPGQSAVNLPITFDPTALAGGVKTGVLTLSCNDPETYEPQVTVNVQVTAPPQEASVSLVHRWSFDDLTDGAGDADASLVGTASVSGGALVLPGGGSRQDYAEVPISATIAAASDLSFEGWITPVVPDPVSPIVQDWSKVWMFGIPGATAETSTYLDFTWDSLLNYPSANFRNEAYETHTRDGVNPPPVPTGSETHLVVVYDSTADLISLFVNGALADTAPWTGEINELGITTQNHLGAPVYHNDPDFAGSINEMRVWRGVLDNNDVAASYGGGPDSVIDPNTIHPDPDPISISGVQVTGGNIVITGTGGLVNGQTYHLETGVTLTDFAAVPGSDFTGGDPIPTVPASGPKRFVRIASGPGVVIE